MPDAHDAKDASPATCICSRAMLVGIRGARVSQLAGISHAAPSSEDTRLRRFAAASADRDGSC
jgi:hypothetical protein